MFWAACDSRGWGLVDGGVGGGGWVDGGVGGRGAPTHAHMHAHTCTHAHTHVQKLQMAADMEASMFIMFMHVCACICMYVGACMCVWDTPTHPYQPPPHLPICQPPRGEPWNQLKFNNTWTNQDISILFEDLKSVKNFHSIGGCMAWWVGWWVGSGQNTKNFKNVDWIKIIQFCLKIYDLYRHPNPWVGGMLDGWVNGWGQVISLTIK